MIFKRGHMVNSALGSTILIVLLCGSSYGALGVVEGCIKDENGRPAVKYIVYISRSDHGNIFRVRTNNKGCYGHYGVPEGLYQVSVAWPETGDHPRSRAIAGFKSPEFMVRAGELSRHDFDFKESLYEAQRTSVRSPPTTPLTDQAQIDPLTGKATIGNGFETADWAKIESITAHIEEWRRLAQAGNAEWQYRLGVLYETGRGVPRDASQAFSWSIQAAKQGYPDSLTVVGLDYLYGHGTTPDRDAGIYWLTKSANQGDASGMWALGNIYVQGHGVPQDFVQGHLWLNLAASRGWKIAADARDRLALKMTPSQIATAQAMATDWRPQLSKALESEEKAPPEKESKHYLMPYDIPNDLPSLQSQAQLGSAEAQYRVGFAYLFGINAGKDAGLAVKWLKSACEGGIVEGCYDLAFLYLQGEGFGAFQN